MQGDLVLCRVQTTKGKNKLTPPWEGPFIVGEVLRSGTYKLTNMKGEIYTNARNVDLLRRVYMRESSPILGPSLQMVYHQPTINVVGSTNKTISMHLGLN